MDVYMCEVCGYLYDPEEGDEDNRIRPGTRFSRLPRSWVCPDCGAAKGRFHILGDEEDMDDGDDGDYQYGDGDDDE